MSVTRIFVEKKPDFAVKAKELQEEIKTYLNISTVTHVRVLIRYDIENLSKETYQQSLMNRRWILSMRKNFRQGKRTGFFLWNTFQGSLTSGRILLNSV